MEESPGRRQGADRPQDQAEPGRGLEVDRPRRKDRRPKPLPKPASVKPRGRHARLRRAQTQEGVAAAAAGLGARASVRRLSHPAAVEGGARFARSRARLEHASRRSRPTPGLARRLWTVRSWGQTSGACRAPRADHGAVERQTAPGLFRLRHAVQATEVSCASCRDRAQAAVGGDDGEIGAARAARYSTTNHAGRGWCWMWSACRVDSRDVSKRVEAPYRSGRGEGG